MTEPQLKRLNQRFAEFFGRNPHGGLNYQWLRVRDLTYLYESGTEEAQTPGGIYYVRATYEKHSYRDLYGDGWVLAKWEAPVSPEEWRRRVQSAFPWPKHGEYHPIESTVLPVGREPDEELTLYTVCKLYEHLGMKWPDHLRDAVQQLEQRDRADKSKWSDIVDDMMPAYGNVPGDKQHVSFGGI